MNKKFNPGDQVYCILNSAIAGHITSRNNRHGQYVYTLKVDDEKSFIKHFGLGSVNVVFLHWQLRRI